MQTNITPEASQTGMLARLAGPLLLFSGVLTGLLLFSHLVILPRLTKIDAGGSPKDTAELIQKKSDLTAQIATAEDKRDALLFPLQDATYDLLKQQRMAAPSLDLLRTELFAQAASLSPVKEAVVIAHMTYDAGKKTLAVDGDVRNVGPRSMTVLAQFTDMVSHLSFVASSSTPQYERVDGPDGPHSPFHMVLTLK